MQPQTLEELKELVEYALQACHLNETNDSGAVGFAQESPIRRKVELLPVSRWTKVPDTLDQVEGIRNEETWLIIDGRVSINQAEADKQPGWQVIEWTYFPERVLRSGNLRESREMVVMPSSNKGTVRYQGMSAYQAVEAVLKIFYEELIEETLGSWAALKNRAVRYPEQK